MSDTEVTQLLTAHRAKLDTLTEALLEAETLDGPDAYRAAGVTPPTAVPSEAASGTPS